MESKNLVICDPETKFASAFAQYLTRQKELAVRVRTCSDLSYVLAIQEKEKIDFLLISSEYPEDSRKQVKAGMVFVIAPEREVALENREVPIYKYQPGDQILAEMIRQCSMSGDEKQIFLKITGKKNCRVIAVYSPVRRIGKTTYAIRLGRKLAKEALEMVGLGHRMDHKPSEMSGGQQQRVAIARAIAAKPPVILADEPTGNLDSASSKEILQILKDLHSGGRTVILITHDDKIAEQAYRIIRILDGKIESDRKNDKILESREEIK
mgnify:CR=1 FL=1